MFVGNADLGVPQVIEAVKRSKIMLSSEDVKMAIRSANALKKTMSSKKRRKGEPEKSPVKGDVEAGATLKHERALVCIVCEHAAWMK